MLKPQISSLRAGDPFSWDCAYHWLWPVAYSAAFRRLERIARDQVEDVAVGAIREAAEVVEAGSVESFEDLKALVSVIAERRAKDLIRRLQAEKRSAEATESIEGHEQILPAAMPSPFDLANAHDVARLLTALMAELSQEEYKLLRAFYFRGMKQEEIAEFFGKPLGTIGVKLSRTLKKLRQKIEEHPALMEELLEVLR
jgi:RNA polymerase sigma factor (sigma-70 family)